MAATIGLKFDLSAWKAGIRNASRLVSSGLAHSLKPFNAAVKRSVSQMVTLFRRNAAIIRGALSGAFAPLLAAGGMVLSLAGIKRILESSLKAFRAYSDSVTTLRAALRSLGEANVDRVTASVSRLSAQVRLAMGIQGKDTTTAFSDFLTRGFDPRQARQLTILAANVAKKVGRPLAEVQKQIADAANGSVGALKGLGIQIGATGNAVRDGENAVLALKAAYGDIGADLANPSERLAAAWNELAVSLGERISPIIEPMVQRFSDLVTGLTQTEIGSKMLDEVARSLVSVVEWTVEATAKVSPFVRTVLHGGRVVYNFIREIALQAVAAIADALKQLPGFQFLADKLGFDAKGLGDGLREMARDSARAVAESITEWEKARGDMTGKRVEGSFFSQLEEIQKAGRQAREEAVAALSREAAGTRGEGFAGRAAQDVEARKAAAARARAEQQLRARVQAGDVSSGTRISVNVVSRQPDRFRRARLA